MTILHEGPDKGKPPHNAYGDLASAGVEVVWRDNLEDDVGCIGARDAPQDNSVRRDDTKSPSIKVSSPSVSKPLSLREPGAA